MLDPKAISPGPWSTTDLGEVLSAPVDGGRSVVANVFRHADLRVLGAAPELLECLRDWFVDYAERRGEDDELVRRSRRVIAKATGATHG